ncbi:hypothetical protein [Pseudomonas sp. BF-R-21]|uniref:hypothetical protein n=1 Tax=Pseudomonas sp. BF-R-21 TaxID=2832387 RepID=UPI001CBBDE3C|nr:hypothetical protein [Pseudomonas sp. BF-R-21]
MKLPFGWTGETVATIVSYGGVGLMALGVGIQFGPTGAIAVFALGLPILAIQRHMREQIRVNYMLLQAVHGVHVMLQCQQLNEGMRAEALRDLHALLKRVADEGITRD